MRISAPIALKRNRRERLARMESRTSAHNADTVKLQTNTPRMIASWWFILLPPACSCWPRPCRLREAPHLVLGLWRRQVRKGACENPPIGIEVDCTVSCLWPPLWFKIIDINDAVGEPDAEHHDSDTGRHLKIGIVEECHGRTSGPIQISSCARSSMNPARFKVARIAVKPWKSTCPHKTA